jgi:transposase
MLSLPASVRILLCLQPTDMRRSFDGLAMLVEQVLGESPLSGCLFVFANKRRDRVKILYWEHGGLAIWYKRLEEGTFRLPVSAPGMAGMAMEAVDLWALLEGIDLAQARRRPRYALPPPRNPSTSSG